MDSVPRKQKRKLVDFGSNVTPLKRPGTNGGGDDGNIGQGENELNASNHQRQESNVKSDVDQVFQGKSASRKLTAIVEFSEKDIEKANRARERVIYNDEEEEDEEEEDEEEVDEDEKDDEGQEDDGEDDEEEEEDEEEDGGVDEEDDDDEEDEEESVRTQGVHPGGNFDRREIMWFSTDYIEDIISHEMKKEAAYHLSVTFCRKFDINPTGREILIDWLISVQVNLKAENSTLHLAVALLDIMLDRVHIPINELQAAAVAAFWVAYKYIHGSLSMKALLNLCADSVTKSMVEGNEILVLQTSHLIQAGGSLTVFFNYLLHKIFGFKFPPEIYYCGLYFIEIMLLQFVFIDCPAYEKAVTAVFTALAVFGCPDRFAHVDISNFISKRKLLHVYRRLMRSLRLMYNDREALKKTNVYRKYKSSRYFKISVHQSLKCLASV